MGSSGAREELFVDERSDCISNTCIRSTLGVSVAIVPRVALCGKYVIVTASTLHFLACTVMSAALQALKGVMGM
jgi:hypothetical protein